jgi:hypothetical protein
LSQMEKKMTEAIISEKAALTEATGLLPKKQ